MERELLEEKQTGRPTRRISRWGKKNEVRSIWSRDDLVKEETGGVDYSLVQPIILADNTKSAR